MGKNYKRIYQFNLALASFRTVLTSKSFKFFTEMALKLKFSILTFFGDVWLPNKANPFLSKWDAICAGPVSFAIINFAPYINQNNAFEIFEELESAHMHIEGNGRAKIIFMDLTLKISILIRVKNLTLQSSND